MNTIRQILICFQIICGEKRSSNVTNYLLQTICPVLTSIQVVVVGPWKNLLFQLFFCCCDHATCCISKAIWCVCSSLHWNQLKKYIVLMWQLLCLGNKEIKTALVGTDLIKPLEGKSYLIQSYGHAREGKIFLENDETDKTEKGNIGSSCG